MAFFIGYSTALDFWRSGRSTQSTRLRSCDQLPSEPWPRGGQTTDFLQFGMDPDNIHLVIARQEQRRVSRQITFHVCGDKIPAGSFVRLAKGVYVSSPELTFLQMAETLPFPQLVQLGFELCGSYSITDEDIRGFSSHPPLTSVKSIARYVAKLSGRSGIPAANQALRSVIDGSVSPMESLLTMLLTLPATCGGYGIPQPVLNGRIEVPETKRSSATKNCYYADLLWLKHRVAVEYDSDRFHTDRASIVSDSKRRNALLSMDFSVITATAAQVLDESEFDALAKQIGKLVGHPWRQKAYDEKSRREELRFALLG